MAKCLACYGEVPDGLGEYHSVCARRIFGDDTTPELPFGIEDLESLAQQTIQHQVAVTGVQAKISLHLSRHTAQAGRRFTIVGLWEDYILKPPSTHYPQLPEVEDLTMHLAADAQLKTASHTLIRMSSGHLAYITKRMDRTSKGKLRMEDMCQLTERLTEDKYHASYEQVCRAIQKHSAIPGVDVLQFFEVLVFSFLTGNADMHLKNFSLLEQNTLGMALSPAYDLVNTALVNPKDREEMALTLNGKKRIIKYQDFETAMTNAKLSARQQALIFSKMEGARAQWFERIDTSFLTKDFKTEYQSIIAARFNQLGL